MSSRSDHGIRMPHAGAKIRRARPREATSLPEGLPHYELKRELRQDPDMATLWHHATSVDDNFVPVLAESSPPPFDPIDIEDILGKPGPIEIEIGCGKGRFLSEYAQLHPEKPILAIEWTRPIAWFAADKIARRPELKHAKVLWGDAPFFLRDRMPAGSVSAFHIYFPDPWPKEKAKKRRVLQTSLLLQMRRLAVEGCKFYWGTDYEEYDQYARELLGSTDGIRLIDGAAGPTDGVMTSFEHKYVKEGRPIYRSVWEVVPAG